MLSNEEYRTKLDELDTRRTNAEKVMKGVRSVLKKQHIITGGGKVHKGWNIHSYFLRKEDPTKILYIELYIESPRMGVLDVRIAEMDRKELRRIRKLGLASIGSEEAAIIRTLEPRGPILVSRDAIVSFVEEVLERKPLKHQPLTKE
jgi:hypothetical protein